MAKSFKYLWPEIGNQAVLEFLERSLISGKIAQTYVFTGTSDLGKFTMALAFARNLQGNPQGFNSDLHILQLEEGKKNISITATRQFIKTLNLSSFLNSYKIGIIKQANLLSPEAQSALLKTLEEPQEKVVIILLVNDEDDLPATILSRAQIIYFYPVASSLIYDYLITSYGTNRSFAKDLANLALGRPLLAVKLLEKPEEYETYLENAELWLTLSEQNINDRLLALDEIFKDRTWSKQAVDRAKQVLIMAEGLSRDLLLLTWGHQELLQHSALSSNLEKTLLFLNKAGNQDNVLTILEQLKLIAQAQEYLQANVNPHLILEQVVINF